jgi:hypothetical protein
MAELSAEGRALLAGREYIKSRGYWLEADGTCAADVDAGLADQSERMKAFLAGAAFRNEPTAALDGGTVEACAKVAEGQAAAFRVEAQRQGKKPGILVHGLEHAAKLIRTLQPQSAGTSGEGERDG